MKIGYTPNFRSSFRKFNKPVHKKFYKQAGFLLRSIRHPSLRSKKYDKSSGIWQARIDQEVRFYFLIDGDVFILLDIKKHPK